MNNNKVFLQELKKKNVQNPTIVNQIFQNPFVRDLPNMAALNGLYCRFLIGEEDIYVAFGYDEAMVYGDFIEARGSMIPLSVVRKCGYFVPELDTQDVVCLFCETRKISGEVADNFDKIVDLMQWMDLFSARCMKHKLHIPMYCCKMDSDDPAFNYVALLDNERVPQSRLRWSFDMQEEFYYKDCFIPEWPISSKSKYPGFQGFLASRYACYRAKLSDIKKLYNAPQKWVDDYSEHAADKNWYLNPWRERMLPQKAADYIIAGMKTMNIPCVQFEVKGYEQTMKFENNFMNNTGLRDNAGNYVTIHFNSTDTGAFLYWYLKYQMTMFTDAELSLGKKLYHQPEKASYIFSVPKVLLYQTVKAFRKQNIPFGYPSDYHRNLCDSNVVWLCADVSEIPRVIPIIHDMETYNNHYHYYGLNWDSTKELRYYAKMRYPANAPESLYVQSNRDAYSREMRFVGEGIDIHGNKLGYAETAPMNPWETPMCIPIEEAVKKGMMIVRREWKEK